MSRQHAATSAFGALHATRDTLPDRRGKHNEVPGNLQSARLA